MTKCLPVPSVSRPMPQCIDVHKVADLTGLGVRTIWRFVAEGRFPRPLKFGGKACRWLLADIEALVSSLRTVAQERGRGPLQPV